MQGGYGETKTGKAWIMRAAAVLGLAVASAGGAWAQSFVPEGDEKPFTATVYDKDAKTETVLFTYRHDPVVVGDVLKVRNSYADPAGKEVYVETAEFEGGRLRRYEQQQKQIGAEGKVEVKDGELHFSYAKDGKTKTAKEKATDNFVVAPSLVNYVKKNWDKIQKGEKVPIRLGVVDRLETVGFQFAKVKDVEVGGKKAVQVKMAPSSFVIAALVKPLLFTFDANGAKVLQLEGRTPLKRQVSGAWKDLDARTEYHHDKKP